MIIHTNGLYNLQLFIDHRLVLTPPNALCHVLESQSTHTFDTKTQKSLTLTLNSGWKSLQQNQSCVWTRCCLLTERFVLKRCVFSVFFMIIMLDSQQGIYAESRKYSAVVLQRQNMIQKVQQKKCSILFTACWQQKRILTKVPDHFQILEV